jgi:hypothetical protein
MIQENLWGALAKPLPLYIDSFHIPKRRLKKPIAIAENNKSSTFQFIFHNLYLFECKYIF